MLAGRTGTTVSDDDARAVVDAMSSLPRTPRSGRLSRDCAHTALNVIALTNSVLPVAEAQLQRAGLRDLVDAVLSADTVGRLKSVGFTALALLLSVRTKNPALGIAAPVVLGFAMQLLGSISSLDLTRELLPTTPFETWHGLFAQHPFTGPFITGLAVSAVWTVLCLAGAYVSLRRRDITEG
jgi:hypothetical protein